MNRQQFDRRRPKRGQAIVEMALVLPLMVFLVMNFLGIMVEIVAQNQLEASLNLAAQSAVTAPPDDPATSCTYASQAFWSTMYAQTALSSDPFDTTGAPPACPTSSSGATSFSTMRTSPNGAIATVTDFNCIAPGPPGPPGTPPLPYPSYFLHYNTPPNGVLPKVTCSGTEKVDFSHSVLGLFVYWSPTFSAQATSAQTFARACPAGQTCQ